MAKAKIETDDLAAVLSVVDGYLGERGQCFTDRTRTTSVERAA
jgi:hypothetical protein